jgi:hypothetical protein
MFDGGNILNTELASKISYSDSVIADSDFFGQGSRYFTQKYDGLFVFAADNNGAQEFTVVSNYGNDGDG